MTADVKRFYATVDVSGEAPYKILLDGKPAKTPGGGQQAIPTRALADAIAEEWRGQGPRLDLAAMVLTRTANTVIDRIAPRRYEVIDDVAKYASNDLLSYRAETPETLVKRQTDTWDPWLDWVFQQTGARLKVANGIVHVEQDKSSLAAIRAAMETFDSFSLPALHAGVTITGSAVLGLAFARRVIGPDEVLAASQIDEDFQAERWGRDAEAETVRKNRLDELRKARRLLDLLAG
ncbi:MAG: ATP12 family protein [Micropepsaceae bacterium]